MLSKLTFEDLTHPLHCVLGHLVMFSCLKDLLLLRALRVLKRVVLAIGATEATMELVETELSTLQGGPLPAINPINGLMKSYKWVTGFIKLLLGVIALFITGSGAHLVCRVFLRPRNSAT